jgi:hypothetical protein
MQETNTDSLFIERGNAAEHLLTSEQYQMATNELVNYYLGSFVSSKTLDKESREASYHAVKAVQDMTGLLNQWVAIRDQIIEAINQNEEPDSI